MRQERPLVARVPAEVVDEEVRRRDDRDDRVRVNAASAP
jgi:hypothetical protein